MNDIVVKENISSMIYEVRGKYVILDSDLAKLFGVETKYLNRIVKRNYGKFLNNNCFELLFDEYETLSRCQNVTLNTTLRSQSATLNNSGRGRNLKYPHRALTREGISILSSIMRSDRVKEVAKELLYEFDKLENKDNLIIKGQNIENMIYKIRGKQVILDSDLAYLYQCKNGTKTINLAVKRHIERFPEDFYFQLTEEEIPLSLRFQVETLNESGNGRGKHIKYLPYAFTEQGVAMLSAVLRTSVATQVSIDIMRAFVVMKHYLIQNGDIYKSITRINNKLKDHDDKFDEVFSYFKPKELMYFKGQIYDAYSDILKIFKQAKKELIIIDGYTDISLLNIIRNIKCDIILITKQNTKLTKDDTDKYNEQYHNLKVIYDNTFHDRYFVLDKSVIYHSGTSINHAGSKTFSINLLEDKLMKDTLIDNINRIMKL
ncbi:MAG: ORF6N domain-containing protein [Bacilli bacterium]|nr:ORF6N domain-containing protein [Bacilli bacterium]